MHCRLYQATAPGQTWQKNGEVTFDERGWEAFAALLRGRIEMLPEDVESRGDHAGDHANGVNRG